MHNFKIILLQKRFTIIRKKSNLYITVSLQKLLEGQGPGNKTGFFVTGLWGSIRGKKKKKKSRCNTCRFCWFTLLLFATLTFYISMAKGVDLNTKQNKIKQFSSIRYLKRVSRCEAIYLEKTGKQKYHFRGRPSHSRHL